MAKLTNIQWMSGGRKLQGGTLNSLVGCSPISEGCQNCYATDECWMKQCRSDDLGKDFAGTVKELSNGKRKFTGKVNYIRKRLLAVLADPQLRSYFVNSLSDVFHDDVTDATILEHFEIFAKAYWQEFRILTKRPERMLAMNETISWPANVQMGVTVESVRRLNRIVLLGQTDAKHKFISFEPWLTPWPEDSTQSIRNAFPLTIEGKEYPALRDLLD
jgi:protein gp37